MTEQADRPPLPPFTAETAARKVQAAEDAWNTRDPGRVAAAYTPDSVWRNRAEFITGRAEIVAFLTRKWERELDYALRKDLWAFAGNLVAPLRLAGIARAASGLGHGGEGGNPRRATRAAAAPPTPAARAASLSMTP